MKSFKPSGLSEGPEITVVKKNYAGKYTSGYNVKERTRSLKPTSQKAALKHAHAA